MPDLQITNNLSSTPQVVTDGAANSSALVITKNDNGFEAITGTTTASATTEIVGSSTSFQSEVSVGDLLYLDSDTDNIAIVIGIESGVPQKLYVDHEVGDGSTQDIYIQRSFLRIDDSSGNVHLSITDKSLFSQYRTEIAPSTNSQKHGSFTNLFDVTLGPTHNNTHSSFGVHTADLVPFKGDHVGITSNITSLNDRDDTDGWGSGGDMWAYFGQVANNAKEANGIAMELCPSNTDENYLDTDITGAPEHLMYGLVIFPDGATRHVTKGIQLNSNGAAGFSSGIQLTGFVDTGIVIESYNSDRNPGGTAELSDMVGLRFLDNMENLVMIQRANQEAWMLKAPNNSDYLSFQYDINGKILSVVSIPKVAGSGYVENDILNVSGGTGGQVRVLEVSSGAVTKIGLEASGSGGYTTGQKTTTGGTGSGCEILINGILNPANAKDLLVLKNDGNIGIGTTAPGYRLDIREGDLRVEGSEFDSSGDLARFFMGNGTFGISAEYGLGLHLAVYKDGGGGKLGSLSYDAVTILESSGNVGIGTTTPGYKLDVNGGDARVAGERFTTTDDKARLYMGNGVTGFSAVYGTGLQLAVYKGGSTGSLGNLSYDAVTILESSGNVGIGTESPSAKLDINPGTISDSNPNIRLEGVTSTVPSGGNNGDIQIYESGSTRRLYIKINGAWRYAALT